VTKLAVVLFNLGGPDNQEAVKPFLFNLFRDPAIITLPAVARYPLAALISTTREKTAQANYRVIGGGSPLLPETEAQGRALEAALKAVAPDVEAKCFIAMRYWKPFAAETAKAVASFAPDEIVLLPLYPQYLDHHDRLVAEGLAAAYRARPSRASAATRPPRPGARPTPTRSASSGDGGQAGNVRLLFSAHGLPQKIVDGGDPYGRRSRRPPRRSASCCRNSPTGRSASRAGSGA
jgi:ferrochelatase